MKPLVKGLIVALVHVCIVASLGVKLLYDRVTLPRVWVKALSYDPNLPIRGRYVRLRLVVEPRGIKEPDPGKKEYEWPVQPVVLRVENDRLLAEAKQQDAYHSSGLNVQYVKVGDEIPAVLVEPVAFFIPEHVPDPSRRLPGEQLWIEATIPNNGPPRPIALGVAKDGGPIVPLELEQDLPTGSLRRTDRLTGLNRRVRAFMAGTILAPVHFPRNGIRLLKVSGDWQDQSTEGSS